MSNDQMPNFGQEEFQVATEKKGTRPAALIFLAVAIVGGGAFLFYKNGPASASAAAPAAAEAPNEAQKSIAEFLQVGNQNISDIQRGLRNTESVVKQFNSYAEMTQVPLSDLKSNPFKADGAKPNDGTPSPVQTQTGPSAEELAKMALAAQKVKATDAAAKLRIESIMTGRNGTGGSAMINGEFVKVGGRIGDFTVESIKPGVVVVADGTFRFERRLGQ